MEGESTSHRSLNILLIVSAECYIDKSYRSNMKGYKYHGSLVAALTHDACHSEVTSSD